MADYQAGTATVDIIPSLRGFQRRITSELKGINPDVTVDIKPDLSGFARAIESTKAPTVEAKVDTTQASAELRAFAARASRAAKVSGRVSLDTGAAMAKLTALSAAGAGIGIGIAGGVGIAGAALATLPASIAAVGAAGAVLAVGMQGVGDALSNAFDPTKVEEFNKAMAKLHPEARAFVTAIQAAKPAFDQMKNSVQGALFAGLGQQFSAFATTVLPAMSRNLTVVAEAMNLLAKDMLAFLSSAPVMAQFKTIFTGLGNVVTALGPALHTFASLLLQLAAAAMPGIVMLVNAVNTIGLALQRAFQPLINSGAITQAFTLLAQLISALAPILGIVVKFAVQLFSALGPSLIAVVQALTPVFQLLANVLLMMAPFVGRIATMLAQVLLPVMAALKPVIAALLPVIVSLVNSALMLLLPLIQAAARIFMALMPAIEMVIQAVAMLVPALVPLIVQLTNALVPIIKALLAALMPVIPVVIKLATSLLSALMPILPIIANLFVTVIRAVMPLIPPLLQLAMTIIPLLVSVVNTLMPILTLLAGIFTDVLAFVLKTIVVPILKFLIGIVQRVMDVFTWLWKNVIKPYWTAIYRIIQWAWENVVKPVFDGIKWFISNILGPAFNWLYRNVIKPVWDAISTAIEWAWNNVIKPVFNFIQDALKVAGDAFDSYGETVESIWETIKDAFKSGVNWVIDKLNWMIDKLNVVLGVFDLEIPLIPKLESGGSIGKQVQQLATGGTIGSGFVTNGPTAIVGEGNPRYPEYVIPTDPKYRSNARALYSAAGTQLMASGGVLGVPQLEGGGILGWLGDLAGSAWEGIKNVGEGIAWLGQKSWDLIKHGAAWVMDHSIKPIIDWIKGLLPDNLLGDIAKGTVDKLYGGIRGFLDDKESEVKKAGKQYREMGGARVAGARAAGQWLPVVQKALRMLNLPLGLAGRVVQQIAIESGGNPNAVNNWDINARRGTPSKGLLQTIGPTFRANMYPGHGNILAPLDNILAAIRYAIRRYGSIANVWPTRAGYDQGGVAFGAGLFPKYTSEPERILSPAQTRAFDTLVESITRNGSFSPDGYAGDVNVQVFIGDEDFTDFIDTRIQYDHQQSTRMLRAGRR